MGKRGQKKIAVKARLSFSESGLDRGIHLPLDAGKQG